MESSPPPATSRAKKSLENYASSYLGAYLNTVKKEHPDHVPALARNEFYDIDVCLMPNDCFAILFEKSDKQNVGVAERDWGYVEGKVQTGVTHLVAVYAHEGATVADAIARGKRDAVRDIRSVEDSNIGKAITQLERILGELSRVEQGNSGIAQLGELELKKLQPVKEAVLKAGPEMDMLAIVDAMRNYSGGPGSSKVSIELKGKELLEKIVSDLGDLADVIRRVESQDAKLQELEQSLNKALAEYNRNIDERISKGLAVILSSSDKKIDKGLAALGTMKKGAANQGGDKEQSADLTSRLAKMDKAVQALHIQLQEVASRRLPSVELPKDLEVRLDTLEKNNQAVEMQVLEKLSVMEQRQLKGNEKRDAAGGSKEEADALAALTVRVEELRVGLERLHQSAALLPELKETMSQLAQRMAKAEESLQRQQPSPRQRTLKQKEPDKSAQADQGPAQS